MGQRVNHLHAYCALMRCIWAPFVLALCVALMRCHRHPANAFAARLFFATGLVIVSLNP
jgi:hypothetical protein